MPASKDEKMIFLGWETVQEPEAVRVTAINEQKTPAHASIVVSVEDALPPPPVPEPDELMHEGTYCLYKNSGAEKMCSLKCLGEKVCPASVSSTECCKNRAMAAQ